VVLVDEGLSYEFWDVSILHTSFALRLGRKMAGDRLQEALKVRDDDVAWPHSHVAQLTQQLALTPSQEEAQKKGWWQFWKWGNSERRSTKGIGEPTSRHRWQRNGVMKMSPMLLPFSRQYIMINAKVYHSTYLEPSWMTSLSHLRVIVSSGYLPTTTERWIGADWEDMVMRYGVLNPILEELAREGSIKITYGSMGI
jgi:hypothetical protein